MALAATILLSVSLLSGDEPVLCTDLDMTQVSVVTGRVERTTVSRREHRAGWLPFGWEIRYEVTAVIRPTRTLRGTPVARTVVAQETCITPWTDIAGRRSCSSLFSEGETDVFEVDRRTFGANRNPDRDEVADYDRRLSRPLPRCVR